MSNRFQDAVFSKEISQGLAKQFVGNNTRMIRINELVVLLGLSRSAIYERMDEGSKYHDPAFPKRYKLSSFGAGRAVGWRLDEVFAYISRISDHPVKEAA